MKNTNIYTVEITEISGLPPVEEDVLAEAIRNVMSVDDAVVTKVQVFEGTDSAKE